MARDIGRIMIQLDTSVLIEHLTGSPQSSSPLRAALETGERLGLSAIALYEWLRGDRRPEEVEAQERLFPSQVAVAFGPAEARVAADLYRLVGRARTREADIGDRGLRVGRRGAPLDAQREGLRRHPGTAASTDRHSNRPPVKRAAPVLSAAGTSSGTSPPPCSAGPPRSRSAPCRPARGAAAPPSGRGRSRPRARR